MRNYEPQFELIRVNIDSGQQWDQKLITELSLHSPHVSLMPRRRGRAPPMFRGTDPFLHNSVWREMPYLSLELQVPPVTKALGPPSAIFVDSCRAILGDIY